MMTDEVPSKVADRIHELALKLQELKREKECIERDLKATNEKIEQIELFDLPKIFETQDIQTIKFQGIGTVFLRREVNVTVLADDRPRFHAYLRDTGQGDMISEQVHHRRLSSWGRNLLEENMSPPDYVKVHLRPKASIRKA